MKKEKEKEKENEKVKNLIKVIEGAYLKYGLTQDRKDNMLKNEKNKDSIYNPHSETAFTFMMLGALDKWEQKENIIDIRDSKDRDKNYQNKENILSNIMKKKNSYLKEIFSISDKNLILFEFRVPNHAFEINKIKYKGTQFDAIIFDVDMKKIIGIEAKLMSDDSGSGDSGKSQLSRNLDVLTDIKKENTYWQGWNTEYYVICPKNLNTEYMVELYHNKENIKYLFWDDLYNKYLKEDKIIDTFINMKNNNGNGNDNGNGSNNYNDKLRQLVVGKFFKFKELKKE